MDKNAIILQPNRKTTNKRIKRKELMRLRLYSIELNRLVVAQLALAKQQNDEQLVSEIVPMIAKSSNDE